MAAQRVASQRPGLFPWRGCRVAIVLATSTFAFGNMALERLDSQQPSQPPPVLNPRVDLFGDPLPEGAIMRLGTVGYRMPELAGIGFRPGGELVAVSNDLELFVWPNDGTAKPKITIIGGKKEPGAHRAISADGRFVVVPEHGSERKVVVWDISTGVPIQHLERQFDPTHWVCFSPNGEWLAINETPNPKPGIARQGAVWLGHIASKSWQPFPIPGLHAEFLSFSADGSWLAIGGYREIIVIDTAKNIESCRVEFDDTRPRYADLSPDGKTLAVLPMTWMHGPEPKVRFFAVPSGKEIATMKPVSGQMAHWVKFSPDGKTVLLGSNFGICEWDPTSGKLVREIEGPAELPAVFSADRQLLASGSHSAVLLWDLKKQKHVRPDLIEAGHWDRVLGITVSPDGKVIATNSLDGEVRFWSAASGKQLFRIRSSWTNDHGVVFLPDSKTFIAVATDFVTPVLYDAANGKELRRFSVPAEAAKSESTRDLQLSANGHTLTTRSMPVSANGKGFLVRWNVANGQQTERLELSENPIMEQLSFAAYSPDGQWVVRSGALIRTDTKDKTELVPPQESSWGWTQFSDDSRLLSVVRTPRIEGRQNLEATGVAIFELASKVKIAEIPTGRVFGQAFSKDNRYLAVVGRDQTTVWEIATTKLLRKFIVDHGLGLTKAIAFTPDGRRLITGQLDSTALIWELADSSGGGQSGAPFSPEALAAQWDALAGADGAKAYAAGCELMDRPQQALPLLRDKLQPIRAADEAVVRDLIAKLGATSFAEREAASKKLRELDEAAVAALRMAVKGELSAEQRNRVERLLAAATALDLQPGERLRQVRAVAVLEHIHNEVARQLLVELAKGVADARQTREAAEALQRFGHTPPK